MVKGRCPAAAHRSLPPESRGVGILGWRAANGSVVGLFLCRAARAGMAVPIDRRRQKYTAAQQAQGYDRPAFVGNVVLAGHVDRGPDAGQREQRIGEWRGHAGGAIGEVATLVAVGQWLDEGP